MAALEPAGVNTEVDIADPGPEAQNDITILNNIADLLA